MGNICSSSKNEPEAFSRPGRVLGSNAASSNPAPRASVPAKTNWQSPGRTLGGGDTPSRESKPATGNGDARANAAVAAQKRAEATSSSNKGKLGSMLAAQKAQTQTQTLVEVSRDERAARDADGASAARRWD